MVQWCTQVPVQPGQGPEQLLIQGLGATVTVRTSLGLALALLPVPAGLCLTIVLCRHWVLDEGRELVEDVVACCVGLPVPRCQARKAVGVSGLRTPIRP